MVKIRIAAMPVFLLAASCAPLGATRGVPAEPAESTELFEVFEPFADAVCRAEAEDAVILQEKLVKVEPAGDGAPFSCGSHNTEEWSRWWREHSSGDRVLHFAPLFGAPAETPPIARIAFRVPEEGDYYLFLKGDAWCCPSLGFRFRVDAGPVQSNNGDYDCWGIGAWSWVPLGCRSVRIAQHPHASTFLLPLPHRLGAGEHSLEILWAEAPCAGLILDQLAVARSPRLENASELLREAAWRGDMESAGLLIKLGADVNSPDRDGRTPLQRAKERGNKELAELLRRHGATK